MYTPKLYSKYIFQLKKSFLSGCSKVLDIWDFNPISYPDFLTDEEASIFDAREVGKDFTMVGKDLGRALDCYGRKYAGRN